MSVLYGGRTEIHTPAHTLIVRTMTLLLHTQISDSNCYQVGVQHHHLSHANDAGASGNSYV